MYNEDDEIQFLGGQDYIPEAKDKVAAEKHPTASPVMRRFWTKRNVSIIIAAFAVIALTTFGGLYYLKHYYRAVDFNYPLSRSCGRIFSDLKKSSWTTKHTNTAFAIDSINGVPMRFFNLRGLHASIAEKMPSPDDPKIILITQAWDYYTGDNNEPHYLGEFILNGIQSSRGKGRAGFVIITTQGWQIGVSQSDSIRNYVLEQHGSMFRQFALVSAGQICLKQFALKGKVHRRALARKPNSASAYYVETVHKESLYDFAEALADYGFIDAIYLTGADGTEPYFRDSDGNMRGNKKAWMHKTNLLIFRN